MKFQFELNGRTFEVSTRTDKKATSSYDTQLTVSDKNGVVAGCIVKKTTPKTEVMATAKKCISMYLTTNYFTL